MKLHSKKTNLTKPLGFILMLFSLCSCGEKYISPSDIDRVEYSKNKIFKYNQSKDLVTGTMVDYSRSTGNVMTFYYIQNGKNIGRTHFEHKIPDLGNFSDIKLSDGKTVHLSNIIDYEIKEGYVIEYNDGLLYSKHKINWEKYLLNGDLEYVEEIIRFDSSGNKIEK